VNTPVLLFDVEGTTTDIAFVHRVLFPYARTRIADFVRAHPLHPAVAQVLAELPADSGVEDVARQLLTWIDEDRKHGALKELQGLIWDEGYASGAFQGHVYPDVRPAWERWRAEGKRLAIYSSGSVRAQQAIYRHSTDGDLTPLLEAHFDTSVGAKREAESYRKIAAALDVSPAAVTFYSDIREELDAAREAGMVTVQVFRDVPTRDQGHTAVEDFR